MAAKNTQDAVSDDFDYEQWAPIARKRLIDNGVWDVVVNGVPPDPTKIPEKAATINVVDLAQWRNRVIKNLKALKIIQSSLTDSTFRNTVSISSAKDLWNLLKKGNEERKLRRLENKYDEFRMNEGESMDHYLERLFDLMFKFNIAKDTKSDHVVIRTMLTSLRSSYDSDVLQVIEDLMALPDMTYSDLVDIFYMISLLPSEYILPQMRDYYKSLKQSKSEEGRIIQQRNQKPKHVMFAVTSEDFRYDEDMWMIYTAASDHMTPHEKLFTSLDRTYRAGVEMANGSVVMAEGKGDVMFVMKGVKMMIKNVLFVPRINRNVLSFGQMAQRGYSMEVGRGVCTLRDKTGKVFAKTVPDERGYALRLSVIEGNINSTL